jgi:hypothetical protein
MMGRDEEGNRLALRPRWWLRLRKSRIKEQEEKEEEEARFRRITWREEKRRRLDVD